MYTRFSNNLIITVGPIFILIAAYLIGPSTRVFSSPVSDQLAYIPYVVGIIAAGLGLVYRRHRYMMFSLFVCLAYWILQGHANTSLLDDEQTKTIQLLLMFLFPINYLVITRLHDRSLLSVKGVFTLVIIVGQALLVWWLAQNAPKLVNDVFAYELDLLIGFNNTTNLPTLAVLTLIIAEGVLLFRVIRTLNVFDSGFAASLIAIGLAFNANAHVVEASFHMAIALLLPIGALVKHTYNLAYLDELTELPGRRALNEELQRLSGMYSLAMLDVDHFKKFNDTYGHDLGDQVLRMVAAKLMKISGGGRAFRYGGEEFCVVFHNKTTKEAFPHLSKLRETIDETRMILRSKGRPDKKPEKSKAQSAPWREVHVTISIGVAESGDDLHTYDDVMKAADKALYKAKEKGRNRIHQYQRESAVTSPAI